MHNQLAQQVEFAINARRKLGVAATSFGIDKDFQIITFTIAPRCLQEEHISSEDKVADDEPNTGPPCSLTTSVKASSVVAVQSYGMFHNASQNSGILLGD